MQRTIIILGYATMLYAVHNMSYNLPLKAGLLFYQFRHLAGSIFQESNPTSSQKLTFKI